MQRNLTLPGVRSHANRQLPAKHQALQPRPSNGDGKPFDNNNDDFQEEVSESVVSASNFDAIKKAGPQVESTPVVSRISGTSVGKNNGTQTSEEVKETSASREKRRLVAEKRAIAEPEKVINELQPASADAPPIPKHESDFAQDRVEDADSISAKTSSLSSLSNESDAAGEASLPSEISAAPKPVEPEMHGLIKDTNDLLAINHAYLEQLRDLQKRPVESQRGEQISADKTPDELRPQAPQPNFKPDTTITPLQPKELEPLAVVAKTPVRNRVSIGSVHVEISNPPKAKPTGKPGKATRKVRRAGISSNQSSARSAGRGSRHFGLGQL
ncbi:MAG: hypothetical protein AAF431_00385 [Pseudomonadota bacterium]